MDVSHEIRTALKALEMGELNTERFVDACRCLINGCNETMAELLDSRGWVSASLRSRLESTRSERQAESRDELTSSAMEAECDASDQCLDYVFQ